MLLPKRLLLLILPPTTTPTLTLLKGTATPLQLRYRNYSSQKSDRTYHYCVIGSGPAGFYAAQQLLKLQGNSRIDIYEKLPVPFGLVRYGVAPDHPEVKNVTNTFTTVLKHPNVRFIGNFEAGKDVSFGVLQGAYHAVLLAHGASSVDRKLNIPGEEKYVTSAKDFVGWYNGLPENRDLKIDLKGKRRAFIIGQGNVALDIARILLSPVGVLEKTDISSYALDALKGSDVEEVVICGRRGPLDVSFTIKELREVGNLEGVDYRGGSSDDLFVGITQEFLGGLPRPKRRLTELLLKIISGGQKTDDPRSKRRWSLTFMRSPVRIDQSNDGRLALTLEVNKYKQGQEGGVIGTGQLETEPCDIVFRSVGWKGHRIFPELPFDEARGVVPNEGGKVKEGIYSCGWAGQGPKGVILTTMSNSFEVARRIVGDISGGEYVEKGGFKEVVGGIKKRLTSFEDYRKISEFERINGRKVTSVEEMMGIVESGGSGGGRS